MSFSKLSGDTSMTKWQIALALGGAGLVGGLLYYMTRCDKKEQVSEEDLSMKLQTPDIPAEIVEEITPAVKKISPQDLADEQKVLGNNKFREAKYEEALKHYNEAIRLCPPEKKAALARFYQNKAAAHEQLSCLDGVIENCTKALEFDDRYVKAYNRRSKAYELKNDLVLALEDLTASCILESFSNQSTMMKIDRVIKQLGKESSEKVLEKRAPKIASYFFIESFFNSFCRDPIMKFIQDKSKFTDDELSKKGFVKAAQYVSMQDYDKVLNCCTKELQDPESPYKVLSLLLRGTMHLLHLDRSSSLKDLTAVLEETDDTAIKVNALIKRGSVYLQDENKDKCQEDLEEASLLDPTNPDLLHHRGQLRLLVGESALALQDFHKALESESNFAMALVQGLYSEYREATANIDKTFFAMERAVEELKNSPQVTQIKQRFRQIMDKFPDCVECNISYGQVLLDSGEYEEAEKVYDRALMSKVRNPTILLHKGILKLQRDSDLRGAAALMKEAISIDPRFESAYENLATIEVQTGNLRKGIEYFEKAIEVANTRTELDHLFSMKLAAEAQMKVVTNLNITLPTPPEI